MNITQCMAHRRKDGVRMGEKVYKTMGCTGAWNIVLGVIVMVVGVAAGVMLIVSGGKLLADKSKVLF